MRFRFSILVLLLLVAAGPATVPSTQLSVRPTTRQASPPKPVIFQDGISVYFSPDGDCANTVVFWVNKAEKKIDIAAYSITHVKIAKAIADAHRRGVVVRVVMDKTQAAGKYSSATPLFNAGVPVWTDHVSGLMHNKFLVLDDETVITGSFNLTKGADEDNAENMLVIEGKDLLVKAYSDDFETVKSKSTPYVGIHPEK